MAGRRSSAKSKRNSAARSLRSGRGVGSAVPAQRLLGVRLPVVAVLLLVVVIGSGVQVADQAHQVRRLHATLESMGKQYNVLLAENTRWTLERGARASYAHVEQKAVDELGMHFPEQVVTVAAKTEAP